MFGPSGALPTSMSHDFSKVPKADIQRSVFNRDHNLKTAFDAGLLVPVFVDEALPGDTFTLKMTGFGRLATPIHPVMDNIYIESFFFSVPYRLVWDNWEKMCGAQEDPGDSTDYLVPQATGTIPVGTLYDYMGIPLGGPITFNNLHGRAYNLIWNEWFRDENLQDSAQVDKGDGPDNLNYYQIKRRGKRHDYFTSCLPWPQKGDSVSIPIGTRADVTYDSTAPVDVGAQSSINSLWYRLKTSGAGIVQSYDTSLTAAGQLYADLSTATAVTINALREAFQIQRIYEADARGGTRYTEIIRSHFGVVSPDARLQRPEYLGGGKERININPVAQLSSTDATSPQGNMSAFGTTGGTLGTFNKSFTEHCVLLGLVCVYADLAYMQGLNRMWSRQDRWDFYWPSLAHLGEQAVLNQEIYWQGTAADTQTFGYQERFAEYRYKPNMITGAFRSTAPSSLDSWHLAQEWGSLPVLNDSFIQEQPPMARISAVPSEPDLLLDAFFDLKCARPMPTYSVPGLIDHF